MIVNQYEAILIAGHAGAIITVLGGYFHLHYKLMKKIALLAEIITIFSVEHEIVVNHVKEADGIATSDLPTRRNQLLEMMRDLQK